MNTEQQVKWIEEKANTMISPDKGAFLVEVRIKPINNIKVFVDADQGVSIDALVQYNRSLYRQVEEGGLYPNGDFSLEVSSPGLDEPLKLHRQYLKNKGRDVEVILKNGIKREGRLADVTNDEIVIEEETGNKKKELVKHTIPYDDIKTTKIQISFKSR